MPLQKLQRASLKEGGFAGLREHQLVKSPQVFGATTNNDGSWQGIGQFVYLADARFMPHGETRLHDHHEVDVISIMAEGRLAHEGSMGNGQDLLTNDIQVQRAGGEGFSHNEINPDATWNRMLQLWVLPEQAGQPASYKVYQPQRGEVMRIYGGKAEEGALFAAKTQIDVALLANEQRITVNQPFLAYLSQGAGIANDEAMVAGDLIRGDYLNFSATNDAQLIIIQVAA
jgi:redox-sensitive bicupin YhaK (pirin superfamily)